MIRPEQIPDEVVEAAARAAMDDAGWHWDTADEARRNIWRRTATAAVRAAINVWPGAVGQWNVLDDRMWVTLPLPEAQRIAKQEEPADD